MTMFGVWHVINQCNCKYFFGVSIDGTIAAVLSYHLRVVLTTCCAISKTVFWGFLQHFSCDF